MRHELDLGILILHISCYYKKALQNLWSESLKYWPILLISMFIAYFSGAQLASLNHKQSVPSPYSSAGEQDSE